MAGWGRSGSLAGKSRKALEVDPTLVKTVGLRGTLHPAAEVPMWMAANRLRRPAEERRFAKLGVDVESPHWVVEAIQEMVGPEPITGPISKGGSRPAPVAVGRSWSSAMPPYASI